MQVQNRLFLARALDHRDIVEEIDRAMVAEVVNAVRWSVIGRRRMIEGGQYAGHDIVDIGEIAFHPAVIENLDRAPFDDRRGEQPGRHIRPPPRAVNSEEPQAGRRHAIEVGIGLDQDLTSFLGRPVK